MRAFVIIGLCGLGLSCAAVEGHSAAAAKPEITAIVPASGPSGVAYPIEATIIGHGFAPAGNVVRFGPVELRDLPSPDTRHIRFFVPKLVPSRGEAPPMVFPPGRYEVTVTTPAGISPSMVFTLTDRP